MASDPKRWTNEDKWRLVCALVRCADGEALEYAVALGVDMLRKGEIPSHDRRRVISKREEMSRA